MLLPDIIYRLFNEHYVAGFDSKSSVIALLFSLIISFAKSQKLILFAISICYLWQTTQLMYFHYYGGFYSAFDIELLLLETSDAATGFWDVISYLLLPASISTTLFILAILVTKKSNNGKLSYSFVSIVLIIVLFVPFLQSLKSISSQKFQPNVAHSALKNGFYSTSYFLARRIKSWTGDSIPIVKYKPYEVKELRTAYKPNIILLMGESLSYKNMSLFSYHRKTTPELEKYIDNPNFIFKPSIASAVSTRVSLSLFYNGIYEPNNITQLSSMNTSLYRLANQVGYETYFISTQKNAGGLTYALSPKDIDIWKENKHLDIYDSSYDDRLLMELRNIELGKGAPKFITLHMRSPHTPYIENYPKSMEVYPVDGQNYQDYMNNSYDNSILYSQKVIADIFAHLDSIGEPAYIFITSDHGEMMNVNGKFGHNSVKIEAAKVPFLFYGVNVDNSRISALKNEIGCLTNHYIIHQKIANLIGFEVNNPNFKDDTYYLNGTDVFGEAGYINYSLSELKKDLCN